MARMQQLRIDINGEENTDDNRWEALGFGDNYNAIIYLLRFSDKGKTSISMFRVYRAACHISKRYEYFPWKLMVKTSICIWQRFISCNSKSAIGIETSLYIWQRSVWSHLQVRWWPVQVSLIHRWDYVKIQRQAKNRWEITNVNE